MFIVIAFLVGFGLTYASMVATYNYLRGEVDVQELQLLDHFLIIVFSLMGASVAAMMVAY